MRGYTAKVGLRRPQWTTVWAWSDTSRKWVSIGRTFWPQPAITPDYAHDPAFAHLDTEVPTLRQFEGTITLTPRT